MDLLKVYAIFVLISHLRQTQKTGNHLINSRCLILDVLHNKRYLLKIFTDDLKGSVSSNCNDDLEICYGKFIGPIKGSKNNSFYFASVFEPGNIKFIQR